MRGLDALLEVLTRQLSGEREGSIVLMVGSGMSLPDDASPGVVGAATMATRATEWLVRNGALDTSRSSLALSYQEAFAKLLAQPDGQVIADRLVKNAVLGARIPFLGVLEIIVDNDQVNLMRGIWYDIDNTIYNLARRIPDMQGLEALEQAVQNGAVTFKGAIEFRRMQRPAGN
jgi:hypothetical protein